QRVQIRKRLNVPLTHLTRERECIALDSIQQRGGEASADAIVRAHQILEEDCRRRTIARTNVFDVTLVSELLRMMVDDEIDFVRGLCEMRWLQIHKSNAIEILQVGFCDFVDLDLEQLYHRDVFRSSHTAVRTKRSRLLVPAKHLAKGKPACDSIGIGIV